MRELSLKKMPRLGSIHDTRPVAITITEAVHKAMAIAATASSPAATEPTFLDAAPVKFGPDPVFDGATGVIGEPEATPDPEPDPDPEPEFEPDPAAPVTMGPDEAVPVTNPVAPATPLVLPRGVSSGAMIINGLDCLTQQL